ncbi:MAG TPA: 50S ribosomal protein L9 [Anaerolineae bacterium]|nr:50S ribosomal protein L9 [Anaerolineae bacterium]
MKILLLKDVYKLGRAGDVKKVANGYARNYLIPQGLAVLATPGAISQADRIRKQADVQRTVLNKEMGVVADQLSDVKLTFPVRASETGRLYGSISTRMLAEAISEKVGSEISHRQIDSQPLRMIGEHVVNVRLTVDMIPSIKVIVYREGETPAEAIEEANARAEAEATAEGAVPEFDEETTVPEGTTSLDSDATESEVVEGDIVEGEIMEDIQEGVTEPEED